MFCLLPKNLTLFHLKLLLDNSASFTSSRMKDLCRKSKVKLIFEAPTGCQEPIECLEASDVRCNVKQFAGLT